MRAFLVYLIMLFAPLLLLGAPSETGLPKFRQQQEIVQKASPAPPPTELQPEEAPPCMLEKIIPRTSKRMQEFVENVNRISATEVLEHERIGNDGKRKEHERRKYNYIAIMQEFQPGKLTLDEYRNGVAGNSMFPGDIATTGMPTLALIFHPDHRDEFEMTCDSLSHWEDQPAWVVHFSQRKDKPARMSALRVGFKSYPVRLMGTAWIDSESFQIVHLEADLLQPIPEVRLLTEHQVLDYGPVHFETRDISLWLPKDADIFLDSNGKRFHHRHTFSNYQIFSVDYGQKIADPKQDPASEAIAPLAVSP
jgi:hypothetical protein